MQGQMKWMRFAAICYILCKGYHGRNANSEGVDLDRHPQIFQMKLRLNTPTIVLATLPTRPKLCF